MPPLPGTAHRIALATALLLAAVLRFAELPRQSIWFDEAATIHIVKQPTLGDMMTRIRAEERIPPLHYIILHYWIKLFGDSEISVRLPSALASIAAVWAIYALTKKLFGIDASLAAALLLAASRFQVLYAAEARAYSLMLLLALLSCDLFVRLLESDEKRARSREAANDTRSDSFSALIPSRLRRAFAPSRSLTEPLYILITTALLYTHLYGVFVIAAQWVGFLFARPRPRPQTLNWRRWLLLNLTVLLLFSPWIPTTLAWSRSVALGIWQEPATLADIPAAYRALTGSTAMLIALLPFAALGIRRHPRRSVMLIALALLPVIIPVIAATLGKSAFATRYAIVAPAAVFSLAVAGIVSIRGVWFIFLLLQITLAAIGRAGDWKKPDWRDAAAFLEQNLRPGDVVVINRKNGTYLYDYYVAPRRPDIRRIGFDSTSIPLSNDMVYDSVWLVVHGTERTPRDIIASGPWRLIGPQIFDGVQIFELKLDPRARAGARAVIDEGNSASTSAPAFRDTENPPTP